MSGYIQRQFSEIKLPTRSPLHRVGGKSRLKKRLAELMPVEYEAYYEPFCGAAHLFFHVAPGKSTLIDSDFEPPAVFAGIRDDFESFYKRSEYLFNNHSSEFFFGIKANVQHVADIWYLHAHSIMGKKQTVIKDARYNFVPRPRVSLLNRLRRASLILQGADILCGDWRECSPSPGDFVYLDPPYLGSSGYWQYKGLTYDDHKELLKWAEWQSGRGVLIMHSNSIDASDLWSSKLWRRHGASTRYSSNNYANKDIILKKELLVTNY